MFDLMKFLVNAIYIWYGHASSNFIKTNLLNIKCLVSWNTHTRNNIINCFLLWDLKPFPWLLISSIYQISKKSRETQGDSCVSSQFWYRLIWKHSLWSKKKLDYEELMSIVDAIYVLKIHIIHEQLFCIYKSQWVWSMPFNLVDSHLSILNFLSTLCGTTRNIVVKLYANNCVQLCLIGQDNVVHMMHTARFTMSFIEVSIHFNFFFLLFCDWALCFHLFGFASMHVQLIYAIQHSEYVCIFRIQLALSWTIEITLQEIMYDS